MQKNNEPLAAIWSEHGIGINPADGNIVVSEVMPVTLPGKCISLTPEYFRSVIFSHPELEIKIEEMKALLDDATPSICIPRIMRDLERRADECDKQGWTGQAMAYRDAAGLMRKAMPRA